MVDHVPFSSHLHVLNTVRCLVCDTVYAKPVSGGTASRNPGCPACGYVGWAAVTPAEESARRRSAADQLRDPFAQSG